MEQKWSQVSIKTSGGETITTKTTLLCRRCGGEFFSETLEGNFEGVCPTCLFGSALRESGETLLKTTQMDSRKDTTDCVAGTEFGNYVILGVLGTGGMGVVYRAKQKGLERHVALKILPAGEHAPEVLVERFLHEARAAAALKHPHIVPIHEVSNQDGSYFYSMELVEGRTLGEAIDDFGPGSRKLVEILAKAARAVHFAHEKKVIHRDIKPTNIMVDPKGEPKVLDFGIAKTLGTRPKATATGSAIGTPAYMSPEQVRGAKDIDARADVYSLGAVLYEILTGKVPHEGTSAMEIFKKLATEEVRSPSKTNPKVARDLEVICLKALEKDKYDRYETAEELSADLERYLRGEPIKARPAPWTRKAGRFLQDNIAWGAVTAILLMAGVIIFLATRPKPDPVIAASGSSREGQKNSNIKLSVGKLIDNLRSGEKLRDKTDRDAALAALLQYREPETVQILARELDSLSGALEKKRELDTGKERFLHFLCKALGQLNIREGAAEPLERYLKVEQDLPAEKRNQVRAVPAGEALCLLGGEKADHILTEASEGFGPNGVFWGQVKRLYKRTGVDPSLRGRTAEDHFTRGSLRMAKGFLDDAVADFTRVLQIDPEHVGAWLNRGVVRFRMRDFEGAIADYTRAIRIDPKNFHHWRNRGNARMKNQDPAGAVADLQQALKLAGKDPWARIIRTDLEELRGDRTSPKKTGEGKSD